ncbi:unnamed protein product [Rotaria socialis]|uniref:Poly [ADP-ribose] polymerase n=1 Tax=Rotaria socialis TaxID=392032 RepID=A0A818V074_9BILA|nr:unnamed protein product [Rotaria socialis]
MSSENDENKLKKGLEEIIEIIKDINYEKSSFINSNEIFQFNKQMMENLTNVINNKLKCLLDTLSLKYQDYFLDFFNDYNYDYSKGIFNETIKIYILEQLSEDLNGIIYSFDAFKSSFDGNFSVVKNFIEKYPKYKDKCSIYDTTLLYSSSRNNYFHIVKYLIEQDLNLPQSTIFDNNEMKLNSIWEYKIINGNQWILFDNNQSNRLRNALISIENEEFNMNINNYLYSISLMKCLSSQISNSSINEYLWIRCRGSSIENFHIYSTWQIMFNEYLSIKINKSISLEVLNIDHTNIKLNHWYQLSHFINQQIDNGINYRRKYLYIDIDSIDNQLFLFNLEEFSFSNNDQTINGFIRWIPEFLLKNDQFIIHKYKPSNGNSHSLPVYINIQQSTILNQQQYLTTDINHDENFHENESMIVRFGNIIEEKSDVIVIWWSSKSLLELIYEYGGSSVRNTINHKFENKSDNPIISIQSDGFIQSKMIYFIDLEIQSDIILVKKSIESIINSIMEKVHENNYKRISFSSIDFNSNIYPLESIIETIIEQIHQQQFLHKNIFVSFIIESNKKDIFNYFYEHLNSLNQSISQNSISKTIENSQIQLEKGDIIKQKVDAIVVSSSSDILKQLIIIEGGEQVYESYEKENKLNPNSLLISCPSGNLLCKRIFFVKWNPNENEFILQQSINDFINILIQNLLSYNYKSIALPLIGSNHKNISTPIVIKTIINQFIYQIKSRNLSINIKFIILPDQDQIYQEFYQQLLHSHEQQDNQLINYDEIPSTWDLSDETRNRFIVSFHLNEYKTVHDEFNQLMKGKIKKIIQIERIQNQRWYFQYLAHKKDFFKRLNKNTEKRLYHASKFKLNNSIINDCFNRSFAGLHGTAYGMGVYFSSDPSYCHHFAKPNSNGERSMFIAQVLIGETILGNSSMKTRPPGYDTTTDGNHIFVIYHDAQAYAQYLITYK